MAISTLPPSSDLQPQQQECSSYVQQIGAEVSYAAKNALSELGATLPCDERTLEKRPTDTEELTPIQLAEKMVQADKIEFSKQTGTKLAALSMDAFAGAMKADKEADEAQKGYNEAQKGYNEAQKKYKKTKKDLKDIKEAREKGGKYMDNLI